MAWGNRRDMVAVGAGAPSFQLPDSKGRIYTLEEILAGGPAVFVFYKDSCPVCQLTLPFLERIHRGAGTTLRLYAVSQDDARSVERFSREFGISFTILIDASLDGYPVSNAFGISHVPSCFLIEQDGTVSQAFDGFSKSELEALGRRAGVEPFGAGEYVPEWKAG